MLVVISHFFGQKSECVPVAFALAGRLNSLPCRGKGAVAVCLIYIALLNGERRRKYDIGVSCRVGHKPFMDNGKQILP